MMRFLLACGFALLAPLAAFAQGYSPGDATKRMKLADGFGVRAVAAEPMIRQPLSMSFDARGRLWVLQYLQYPNPAGLKAVKQDQYLRTVWDRVPEPPPRGPKGADRITILSDPDAEGVFRKGVDFVGGLNLASGFCLGRGGVYVVQPPYLLFYADRNGDDVPDGDPEVLLSGFGMEDAHAFANSLEWGPDGWLYGAQGSTVSASIRNPVKPDVPPVEFQQGIWRYHPTRRVFELFSEGGGNTWGLDFDADGEIIAGTNWGGFAMLHQVQGAYYVKGFAKHGPLHNAHTYGYLDHVPYKNFQGGHVTCGGIVYQADAYPAKYRNQYIAGNLLSNAVYWHQLTHAGATYTAAHGGDFLVAHDSWFRPVDLTIGPDGCVYVADWYDKRAAHLDPIDNWDRTNGRVYRIDYDGTPHAKPFDLTKTPPVELVEYLAHPNVWWRREARRILSERGDEEAFQKLREWVIAKRGPPALEALWTLAAADRLTEATLNYALTRGEPAARKWAVRLIGDQPERYPACVKLLPDAARDADAAVRCQLACTAKRLDPANAALLIDALLATPHALDDERFGLLVWWAYEATVARSATEPQYVPMPPAKPFTPLAQQLLSRIVRRSLAADVPAARQQLAHALLALRRPEYDAPILDGLRAGLVGRTPPKDDFALRNLVRTAASPATAALRDEILARLGDADARDEFLSRIADVSRPDAERVRAIELLHELKVPGLANRLAQRLPLPERDSVRVAALAVLETSDDPAVGAAIIDGYASWSPGVRRRAVHTLAARKPTAALLVRAIEQKRLPTTDVSLDEARAMVAFNDAKLTARIEALFGKVGPATPGEKQARIAWLGMALARLKGDAVAGKALFVTHCQKCHTLHGEGLKIGPDLTTADRKNRGSLLANIVDPNASIRPEFVSQIIVLRDGRTLTGLAVGSSAESLTLVDAENRRTTIPRNDVESEKASPTSMMPEKLLDVLSDQQVADLFAWLAADPPPK